MNKAGIILIIGFGLFSNTLLGDTISSSVVKVTKKVISDTKKDIVNNKKDGIEYQLLSVFYINGIKAYKFKLKEYGIKSFFTTTKVDETQISKSLLPITDNETLISISLSSQVVDDEPIMVMITDPSKKPKTLMQQNMETKQLLNEIKKTN